MYTIPLSMDVYAKSENDAIFLVQRFLRSALIEYDLTETIPRHDVIETLLESNRGGCGNYDLFEGVPI
jgi:hypothetical protein